MARFVPIRITKHDRKEYARLVKNTKAKIRRTYKKYGIDLSSEVNIPSLEDFSTRKDFNKWKEKMGSFTNRFNLTYQYRKNPYGVVASKRELNKIERDTKRAQRLAEEKQKEIAKKPFISGGKQQGTVGQQMLQMKKPNVGGITRPPDFDFDKLRSQQELERKADSMERKSTEEHYDKRTVQMQENFIDMLKTSFNSDADKLVEEIQKLSPDVFFDMYMIFDEFDFDLYYPIEGVEDSGGTQNDINIMLNNIERYHRDIDKDLKGF